MSEKRTPREWYACVDEYGCTYMNTSPYICFEKDKNKGEYFIVREVIEEASDSESPTNLLLKPTIISSQDELTQARETVRKQQELIKELVSVAHAFHHDLWFEDRPHASCGFCDMGDSGWASKGPGHHDDLKHYKCLLLRTKDILDRARLTLEEKK